MLSQANIGKELYANTMSYLKMLFLTLILLFVNEDKLIFL